MRSKLFSNKAVELASTTAIVCLFIASASCASSYKQLACHQSTVVILTSDIFPITAEHRSFALGNVAREQEKLLVDDAEFPPIGRQSSSPIVQPTGNPEYAESDANMSSAAIELLNAQRALADHDTSSTLADLRRAYILIDRARPIYDSYRAQALIYTKNAALLVRAGDVTTFAKAQQIIANAINQVYKALQLHSEAPVRHYPGGLESTVPLSNSNIGKSGNPPDRILSNAPFINMLTAASFLRAAKREISAHEHDSMVDSDLRIAYSTLNQTPLPNYAYWSTADQDIHSAILSLQSSDSSRDSKVVSDINDALNQLAQAKGSF